MAESATVIAERIYDSVLTTLGGITAGDTYSTTLIVEEVEAGIGNPERNGLTVVLVDALTPVEPGAEHAQSATVWQLELTVLSKCVVSATATVNVQRQLMRQWADVYKALCADYGNRGGLARVTYVDSAEFEVAADASAGAVAIPVIVQFQTNPYDPENQ
jgi:hypothetical protein